MSTRESLTIRRRRQSDLQELGKVLVRVHDLDGYPVEGVSDAHGWLQPPHEMTSWTALWGGQPVGQVSLCEATTDDDAARAWLKERNGSFSDIAVVVRLFVDPDHRGHGAGQQLMRAAHEYALGLGKRLVFDVMLKDRRAIRLYEALGCERLSQITHHHSNGREEPATVYVAPV